MDYNKFDTNMFEHDYILAQLQMLEVDLKRGVQASRALDKCACILTAFMIGQIIETIKIKNENARGDQLDKIEKEIKHWRMLYDSWDRTGTHQTVLGAFLDKLEKIIL